MKRIKMSVVRSITTEELYEVVVDDDVAKEIIAAMEGKDKDLIADMVEDARQKAQRHGEIAMYKETGVNDKVTFVKIKVLNVKE